MISEDRYLIYDFPEHSWFKWTAKKMLNYWDRVYYKVIYNFVKPQKNIEYKYKVSICAIFKDEADYLREWIEFHKIVGVEHFYLYNNKSSDHYLSVLEPYINEGLVTLKDWPKPQSQMEAYKDFIEEYGKETHWVGFIDLDEYVIPNRDDTIQEFLNSFENRPAVVIYWKHFGSSGFINRDVHGLITEDFTISWSKYINIGKFFFNTDYEYNPDYKKNNYMHYMWAKVKGVNIPPVNLFDKVCTYNYNPVCSDKMPIQINHYLVKSFQEYVDKKSKRGGGVHPVGMHDLGYFFDHEKKCCDTDYHAYKYLIKLKLIMNKAENKKE